MGSWLGPLTDCVLEFLVTWWVRIITGDDPARCDSRTCPSLRDRRLLACRNDNEPRSRGPREIHRRHTRGAAGAANHVWRIEEIVARPD
jgi:hypothetical protein